MKVEHLSSKRTITWLPVVGACDLACSWCNVRGAGPGHEALDLDGVRRRLRLVRETGAKAIGFGFRHTEPMMSADLPTMVKEARKVGFRDIWLSTSGLRLALPGTTRDLARIGLTHVLISIPTTDEAVGDALLGREGATRAKLDAIENATRAGLFTSVVVMLTRPSLDDLPRTVSELKARVERGRGPLRVNGCLMDPVPALELRFRELVWPRYEEVAWAMRSARAVAPGLHVLSSDMPLCVRLRVPGIQPKLRQRVGDQGDVAFTKLPFCRRCPARRFCRGFETSYLESSPALLRASSPWSGAKPPPKVDLALLRRTLWGKQLPLEPVATELRAVAETGRYACWSSHLDDALRGLQREGTAIAGYQIASVSVGRGRGEVNLRGHGESFAIIVERAGVAEKYFLAGRQHTLSTRGHVEVTERREACMRGLLARLEAADADVQGTTHPSGSAGSNGFDKEI